jgi:hypothetical protein
MFLIIEYIYSQVNIIIKLKETIKIIINNYI